MLTRHARPRASSTRPAGPTPRSPTGVPFTLCNLSCRARTAPRRRADAPRAGKVRAVEPAPVATPDRRAGRRPGRSARRSSPAPAAPEPIAVRPRPRRRSRTGCSWPCGCWSWPAGSPPWWRPASRGRPGLAARRRCGRGRDGVLLGARGPHRRPPGRRRRRWPWCSALLVVLQRRGLPAHRRRGDDLRRLGGARRDGDDARRCGSSAPSARCVVAVLDRRRSARWPPSASSRWSRWCASSTSRSAWPWSARSASSTGSAPACTASAAAGWWSSLIGGVVLAVTLLYAEMLRRYGSPDLVDHLLDGVALEPRPPRRLPAPDRDRPRRPGARLGRATCGPGAGRAGGCAPSASPPPPRSPTRW